MAWNITGNISERAKPKIGICIPHTNEVTMYWVEKAYGPIRFTPVSWCDKKTYLSYGPPIHIARNELCRSALDDGMDYIFFLDTDIVPRDPENINLSLFKLYSLQAPLVTGLYRAKKTYGWYWAAWSHITKETKGMQPLVTFSDAVFPVDAAGLGCTLVHREVFEKVPEPWFRWDDANSWSEDFYFFKKCKEYGYTALAYGDVRFDHIGTFMITGDKDKGEVTLLGKIFEDDVNE